MFIVLQLYRIIVRCIYIILKEERFQQIEKIEYLIRILRL
jgi:hypothetical protein